MSKYFGKTWWGQQWLNSLANIDYSNRLPRGSAYARNGSVRSISIEENTINAKVSGSRPKPYDVTLIIPPFFEADIKKLIKAIAGKPVIISKLLNRELDPELLSIAGQHGLKVFPKQWTDFKMQCSCPDWAVPCKHLAAIIYKVSAEIDNNPFLVFQLHKVDLPGELQKENIHIASLSTEVPLLKELLKAGMQKTKKTGSKSMSEIDKGPSATMYQSLNFSSLEPSADSFIQLLPDAPVFYQNSGNFREKYAVSLRKAVKNAQRIIAGKVLLAEYFGKEATYKGKSRTQKPSPVLAIDHHTVLHLSLNTNNEVAIWLRGKRTHFSVDQLCDVLWQIPSAYLNDFQPSVSATRTALILSLNLIANGAVVPQIVRLDNRLYHIRWLPALMSNEVNVLTDMLQDMLPYDLLRLNEDECITNDFATNLLSVFLTSLLKRLSEGLNGDLFIDFFFNGDNYSFNGPGQDALPGGVNAWLQRYYLTRGNYQPAIVVDELKNEKFLVTIHVENRVRPLEKSITLEEVITQNKFQKSRFEILQSVVLLSSFVPGLDNYINTKGDALIIMNANEFGPFLTQVIPVIRLLNINILLPKSLQQILKPKASIHIKQKNRDTTGFMRLDKMLDFDWQVALGDTTISIEAFNKLLKNSEGLIKYKTRYINVSASDLEKLQKHFSSSKHVTAFELLRAALSDEYYGAKISLSDDVKALMKQLTEQSEIPLPASLNANLRPYQKRGYSWMYRNTRIGFGSVIADDMGLGKTLQVITTLLKYKQDGFLEAGKALVVAPTGLLTNWLSEFEKFAPSLQCKLYHGADRKLSKKDTYDVLITTYGIVRSDTEKLKKSTWHVLIIDEAQNIKNPDAAQSKAVKTIPADTFIAMSGTPVENRLSELWSIMDFCNRGYLGSLPDFRESFANPIQNQFDVKVAEKLKVITGPFLLRRLKSDKSIISDLPDKIEIDSYCYLVKEQASLYEKTVQKAMKIIEGIEGADHKSLFARNGLVLQMIMALKQICNHPAQFLKSKMPDASLSGKMQLLFDRLESILEANEKVLIFTQFAEMGILLKQFIAERFSEAPLFYHGGSSLRQRNEMVQSFQTNCADKIFILSLKAAGTGLNLTAANHVIHYDLWWNPAVEAQATDRAYRIGQKSNVMVHRFITKGTFEERINEMIQNKKALADMTIATGESWIGNLSNKELKSLFELV